MSTSTPERKVVNLPFRPTARLLQLLGDELIASPRLAVFEMVKNAYDADATRATVRLETNGGEVSSITVTDDGYGMNLETLESVWLVPGNDHRQNQRRGLRRTPRHGRLPVGEKGLGRFAAHKLGNRIKLVSRSKGSDECQVDIDWHHLTSHQYLEEAMVTIASRPPEIFIGETTGTIIRISELRTEWRRGQARRLHNQITSMCSPFSEQGDFEAVLEVPGNEHWIADLPDVSTILDRAFWKFSFHLQNGDFSWEYDFRYLPGSGLDSRSKKQLSGTLPLPPAGGRGSAGSRITADASTASGIGAVSGVFYAYDRDRQILRNVPGQQALTQYLDESGGIRVYRDGIRVYDYGEQGDDWLGLDLRRVNSPSQRISRNIVLGAVHLSLADSVSLIEKTNREGFVDNEAYQNLRRIILGAIATFESERQLDKDKARRSPSADRQPPRGFDSLMTDLRLQLAKLGVNNGEVQSSLRRIEEHYHEMEVTLLSAGMSGLNLAIIFHEVERGIKSLQQALTANTDISEIEQQVNALMLALDGFSLLLRRNSQSTYTARRLVAQALRLCDLRFKFHRVQVICPLLDGRGDGFTARFAFNLVLGAISNLIDNALYWMRVRWPAVPPDGSPADRMLYIGICHDLAPGPAIVVADNGQGFQGDDPDLLSRPFFTRKPDGMGLGLYYANLAMQLQGGQLMFPTPSEVQLPDGFDGATVALVFKEHK